jgi:shikimate kinase
MRTDGAGRRNLVLIGMPGAGKSTVGVLLAKRTARDFLDTDVLIQSREGRSLQAIVDAEGYLALRGVEERILAGLETAATVIATGGSAVYSEAAMDHLGAGGVRIFLNADLASLRERIRNFETRGLAKRADQSFEQLFEERLPLYRRHADLTVDTTGLRHDEVCDAVLRALDGRHARGRAGQ